MEDSYPRKKFQADVRRDIPLGEDEGDDVEDKDDEDNNFSLDLISLSTISWTTLIANDTDVIWEGKKYLGSP